MLTALLILGMTAVLSFLYFFYLPTFPSRMNSHNHHFIVFWFSCMILVVISIAVVLYLTHAWEDLFRVHVGISFILGLSGLAVGSSSSHQHRLNLIVAKVYVITASISWYGVVYSFIIADEVIRWHHYFRPGLFVAFLTYGSAMITSSWIFPQQSVLETFLINTIGLLTLLTYFWIVERYFIDFLDHSYFVGSVMHTMPIRLSQITSSSQISQSTGTAPNDRTTAAGDMQFFSNHRILYSLILCLCHVTSYGLTCLLGKRSVITSFTNNHHPLTYISTHPLIDAVLGMKPTVSTLEHEEEEDDSNINIGNQQQQRQQQQQQQQQQDRKDHHRMENSYSDTKSLRETLRHRKMATGDPPSSDL